MSDPFGSGPALNQNLDFEVGTGGDLAIAYGEYELRKDLGFRLIQAFADFQGRRTDQATIGDAEILATRTVEEDPRVNRVEEITVWLPDIETLRIEMRLDTVDGDVDVEEVIEVN